MVDFLISVKTDLFTLLGVVFGAALTYFGSLQATRSLEKTSLRAKRLEVSQAACGLLSSSFDSIYELRDLLKYHPENKKEANAEDWQDFSQKITKKLESARESCHKFSTFFHENRLLFPKEIDAKFNNLIQSDISLTLRNDNMIKSNPSRWIEGYDKHVAINNELIEALRIFTGGDKK